MNGLVLFACPACALTNPVFLALSIFAGTVPCAYLLLRSHAHGIRPWGIPRISIARVASLLLMVLGLIPLWFIGLMTHSAVHVAVCIGGLVACCVYLWMRACWLLDEHQVTSTGKELLFPGVLGPAILVLGTTLGTWVLGVLLVAPVFPMFLVPHTVWSAIIGVPVAWFVVAGLNYTFPKAEPFRSSSESGAGSDKAEQSLAAESR